MLEIQNHPKEIYTNLALRTKRTMRENMLDMAPSRYKSGLSAPPVYLKTCKGRRHSERHVL